MHYHNRWDSLIRYWTSKLWPKQHWRLIKAQVLQESAMDPKAQSPAGAMGLLQLMPQTARELGCTDPLDPEQNLSAGITYLSEQYRRFPEIPDETERVWFALASYNGGRGYVNQAIALAYEAEHGVKIPAGHIGGRPGRWTTWDFTGPFLADERCQVNGRRPDHRQMLEYVERISATWQRLIASA
jgi:membrane-bound lytic murein transglycosylase MltF